LDFSPGPDTCTVFIALLSRNWLWHRFLDYSLGFDSSTNFIVKMAHSALYLKYIKCAAGCRQSSEHNLFRFPRNESR
jgi:hypothetical protein